MKLKRILSLCMVLVLLFGIMPWTVIPAEAATTLTLSQLKEKFPDGKYWNHYVNNTTEASDYLRLVSYSEAFGNSVSSTACALHGSADLSYFVGKYDCNYFDGGVQCCGFARKLGYDAYGTKVTTWSKKYTVSSVKPGDVIHYYGDGASASSGHWVFVTAVSGTTVTVGECNWGGNCVIRWGRSFDLSNATSFTIYSAPYALPDVTYEVDTRYPTPFKAYVLSITDKVQCFDSIDGVASSSNKVYVDDECEILEIYTNGWCKFLCPWPGYDNMQTKYAPVSIFLQSGRDWFVKAAFFAEHTVYQKSNLNTPMGSREYSGGVKTLWYWSIYKVGQSGNYSQIIYTTDKGNYCGWLDHTIGPSQSVTFNVEAGSSATNTSFSWTTSGNFAYVNVKIYKDELWTGQDCSIYGATGNAVTKVLPAGTYYAYIEEIDEYDNTCYVQTYDNDNYIVFTVSEHTHSYGSWTTTKAATCTSNGTERRDCKNCEHYETRDVAALGHNLGNWYQTKTPTCNDKGTERRDCSRCSHYETREIAAKGHNYKSVVTAPTCTEQGYTTHTCTNCGDVYVDSYVKALGHSYGEWYVVTDATCEKDGQKRHDCQNCAHYETAVIEAGGHEYETVVIEPTCSEWGYTVHTCAHCGHSYTDNYVEIVDHDYQNGSCKYCGKLEVALGDANGDGKINTTDAKLVMQYELGMIGEDDLNLSAVDVNGDGKINTTDAKLIMQLELGMITEFPKP